MRRRQILREAKQTTETKWKETSLIRCIGNRQSFKARQRERLAMTLQPSQNNNIDKENATPSQAKGKSHTGNTSQMHWDKEGLKTEVDGYEDGKKINWTDLARRYNVTNKKGEVAKNGGQTVQEYLVQQGVNIHRFKRPHEEGVKERMGRRKKLRGLGGEISLPTPETNESLQSQLRLKITNGEYTVGELVVPRKYEKLVLENDGSIVCKEFISEGRKVPLDEIRKRALEKHKQFIRQHNDEYYDEMPRLQVASRLQELNEFDDSEGLTVMRKKLKKLERQRHLMVWHDHSTVANHGYIVFMVASVYDPAFYLTPDEYFQKNGVWVDIQTEVETPEIYMAGRCGSSDVEQLAYIDTRCECLMGLSANLDVVPGVSVSDVMRFFKGDGPAVAFETGQQKGGHYFCSTCGVHAVMSSDLQFVFHCQHVSLKDKQEIILRGFTGRRNSLMKKPKPLKDLSKEDLSEELDSRGLDVKQGTTKANLEKELSDELKGVQRVPALLYNHPINDMESLHLGSYEALACEPMHDISNHIGNVLQELPKHLNQNPKAIFDEALRLTLGGKDTVRACDHRRAIIVITKMLEGKLTETLQTLLNTLVEIQEILYTKDYDRCPRLILRYHNLSFLHFLMCKLEFGSKPLSLTARKLYGKYLHNLVSHQPIQLRMVSGPSANAENEERVFNAVKSITNSTSSYKPAHIVSNIFIRLQAEKELGYSGSSVRQQQSEISNLAAGLATAENTRIKSHVLEDHSRWWQTHLQRISDFLLPGEGVWWTYHEDHNEVEFFDSKSQPNTRPEGPLLHHFRSTTFKAEEEFLMQSWEQCIEQKIKLPMHYLYQPNDNGKVIKHATNFLNKNNTGMSVQLEVDNMTIADEEEGKEEEEEEDEEEEERVIALSLAQDESPDLGLDENEPHKCQTVSLNRQITTDKEKHVTTTSHPPTQTQLAPFTTHPDQNLPSAAHSSTVTHPEDQSKPTELRTKLGKAVQVVLGTTAEVKRFDYLRCLLKKHPNNRDIINDYEHKLARIQTQVLSTKTALKKSLMEWEKEFFLKHKETSATMQQMKANKISSELLTKLKYCDALITQWNIKLG